MSYGQIDVNPPSLLIYGAGGMAREIAWLAESCTAEGVVVAMLDDDPGEHGKVVNGVPVMGLDDACFRYPDAKLVAAVGSPGLREALVGRASAKGLAFATLVHPRVERSRFVEIGEGSVVCVGSVLAPNVVIGRHVQVNRSCDVSHDVILDDYATLSPGVRVSGRVRIGKGAFIGTGATIINGEPDEPIRIGENAVIGAGACVIGHVAAGTTVGGVPARPLR